MNHSESVKNLAAALAKAQGEMENADKSSNNPFFGSKYADLAEIINTARPVLAKHGLSIAQFPGFDGSTVTVENVLMHESGEWLSGLSGAPMPVMTKKDGTVLPPSPQGVGSAITYLRRYSMAAMCMIAQEDDDAEAATAPARHARATPPTVYYADQGGNQNSAPTPEQRMYSKPSEPVGVKHSNGTFDLAETCPFTKHRGKAWAEIVEADPNYVQWAIDKDKVSPAAKQLLGAALALHYETVPPRAPDTKPLSEPAEDLLPF